MKKSAKNDARTFLMLGGGVVWKGMSWGGGLWRVSHGMAFMGYMVCHVQLCYMAWHAWNTCRGLVMSWHDMEYMSGACHVRAWHGTHGIHVGDCHVMACMEYMSGIAMSPCIYVAMPCPVVQKLGRAAKHFSWTLAGLVLLTCLPWPKKPCEHRNHVVL